MSRTLTKNVFIGGVLTDVEEVHTRHDVDTPIGTGSLVMTAPRPSQVDLAAPVRVEAGWDGQTSVIFDGRLAEDEAGFSTSGKTLRATMEGWGKLLWYPQTVDQSVAGPVALNTLFTTFASNRGVPFAFADNATNPDGSSLVFGGVSQVNGGNVTVEKDASPGEVIDRLAALYGYKLFDRPDGVVRLMKVSGAPGGFAVSAYAEGFDILDVRRSQTLAGMANYIEVLGEKYTLADGSQLAVRSFPATLAADTRLGPSGVNRQRISDPDILTNARADAVRNVQEIDRATPSIRYGWTTTGDPARLPGEVVIVVSATAFGDETPTNMWLMRVAHTITGRGWTTAMDGWRGGGTALPAGNDCVTTTLLGSAGKHLGNEYLSHYRRPNPDGLVVTIPFTVAANYSTLTIRGIGHGCNSFSRNTASTASRFEVWQTVGGVYKSVASGEMPRLNENLEKRYPYGETSGGVYTNRYWEDMVIPLSGSLIAGAADLKIYSGKDSSVGDNDDFECASVVLVTCGSSGPVVIL